MGVWEDVYDIVIPVVGDCGEPARTAQYGGVESKYAKPFVFFYSKAYSTATQHASFAWADWSPCFRRLCRVEKDLSHAGQESGSSELELELAPP